MKKLKTISVLMVAVMLIAMVLPLTTTLAATDAKSLSYGVEGENVIEVDGRYFAKEGDTVTLFAYDYETGEKVVLPENVGFNGNSNTIASGNPEAPDTAEFTLDETSTKLTVKSTDDWINYKVADLTTQEEVGSVNLTVNDEVYEQKVLTLKARQYDYVLEGENVVNIDGDWYTLVGDTVTLVAYDKETGEKVAIPENIGFDYSGQIGDGLEGEGEEIVLAIEDYKTTIVTMSTPTLVEKEVFSALKDAKKATLQINVANVTWEFASEDITKTDSMFTPAVQVSAEKFSHIKPNDIKDGLFIEFAYDGELPGKADITLFVGFDKYGDGQKDLNLYYYNELTAQYEAMGTVKYNNGNLKLSLEHCSTYAVTETKLGGTGDTTTSGETTTPEEEKDETPKTGVNTYVVLASALAIISLGAIVVMKRVK